MAKRFGSLQALADVSIDIAAGEIHCLLGENGAGKSTLCNLVFGVYRPDAGEMRLAGAAASAGRPGAGAGQRHRHGPPALQPGRRHDRGREPDARPVARACCGGRSAPRGSRRWRSEYGLALDPSARIQDLSVGERQRVEIVKCLMREPRLLVLDEPTAVLLPAEIEGLLEVCQRVAARGCSVVLVTHKLAEIKKVAHRVTVLRGGRVVAPSSAPAEEIGRLVRAMIQRDLEGPRRRRRARCSARSRPRRRLGSPSRAVETPAPAGDETLQVDGLTVRDAEGVTRLDRTSR